MRGAFEPWDASRCSDTATALQNKQGHWDVQHTAVLLDPLIRAACAVAASRITSILVKSQGIISTTEKNKNRCTQTHTYRYMVSESSREKYVSDKRETLSCPEEAGISDNRAPAEAAATCPLHVLSQWFKVRNTSLFIIGSHNRNLTVMTKITALLSSIHLATGRHD